MRYVSFKDSVRFKKWTPALSRILEVLHQLQNSGKWVPDLVVTSVNDSAHSKTPLSRHYTDEAVDIRTHNFTSEQDTLDFIKMLTALLDRDKDKFTVIYENVGTPNEHIHVQVKKGKKYP